jgi:multidrug efflux system membrane fusion protein
MEFAMLVCPANMTSRLFLSQNFLKKTVTAIALGGLMLVSVGCEHKTDASAQAAAPAMPPPLVVVQTAKQEDVPLYINSIGKAVAAESVTITPRIAGQIIEKCFEDGAMITKDQVLFRLDPVPFEAALASAEAQLQQSRASLNFANIELQRYETIAGTNAISKTDFDTKKNAVQVALAEVAASEAAVRTSKIRLSYCTITAPIAGRAGSRLVDVGNIVKENETPLLSIQKISPIYAEFTVNEQQLVQVRENMANHTLHAMVKLPGDQGEGVQGQLTFLNNAVEAATGTVRLRATLENKDLHFWAGQFVNVQLVVQTVDNAVLVPASSVQLSQTGQYVLSVDDKNNAQLRPVTTGQPHDDWVVVHGIKAGEKVITDGQLMVRPGGPVRLQPEAVAAAPESKKM